MCRHNPGQQMIQHPYQDLIYHWNRRPDSACPSFIRTAQILSYYLLFSDLPAFSRTGASRSTGRGNTIMVVFSVEMLDRVCK